MPGQTPQKTLSKPPWRRLAADVLVRIARRLQPTRESDSRGEALATLVGILPIRVIMVDRDCRVISASRASLAGMGHDPRLAVGRSVFDIDPEYFGPFRAISKRCLAGETVNIPRVRARESADGPDVWLRTTVSPWRDVNDEIAGVISVSVEVTDVMNALEASERSEQLLAMAVELADLHVWELDYATGKLTTTGAAETLFDGSLDPDDVAKDTNITIHPEDRARIADAWRQAMENDTPFRPEYRTNRADGEIVWAACTTKLVRDADGQPARLVGAMQNITARKEDEAALVQAKDAAEAANRAKSVFLATMSHEIRTPLNGVLGMAQAMAADELTPVQRSRLETVRQSGETLLVILNDVLDLSKIEAGKLELEVVHFDLTPLIEGVHATFAQTAAQKGLTFALEMRPGAAGAYRGDSTRLRQVLVNLVSNAIKFTVLGEVRLKVSCDEGLLVFSVQDSGIGIAPERAERLFNKFEQADASTTRKFGGTGLGLAISRELANLMNGDISFESREGVGSEFRLCVQLLRLGDERPVASQATGAGGGFQAGRMIRVLAAEDNSVNQMVLRTLLQQAGIEPRIVDDGAAGVSAWRNEPWDLILMDVQMPVMDGLAATRAIREAEAQSGRRRTPIVALTANAMTHQMDEYLGCGMDAVIAKPIRVEELFKTLLDVLDRNPPEDAPALPERSDLASSA